MCCASSGGLPSPSPVKPGGLFSRSAARSLYSFALLDSGEFPSRDMISLLTHRAEDLILDSTEKRSFAPRRWGQVGELVSFSVVLSLNMTIFRIKVGRFPYWIH